MAQILEVTFPFFGLVLLGWIATRTGALPLTAIAGLNVFVLSFALPCMLFRFALNTPITQMLDPAVVCLWLTTAAMMVTLVFIATKRVLGWSDSAFSALTVAFPNSGFIGVPLLVALLGPQVAPPVIVALTVDMVVTSSVCIALSRIGMGGSFGPSHSVKVALKGVVRNPLPWAIILGSTFSALHLSPPTIVMRAVDMFSDAASPAALFVLGAMLARPRASNTGASPPIFDTWLLVSLKLVAHPMLVLLIGWGLIELGAPLPSFSLTVLALVAALPSASNVPILAERFGADSSRLARVVMITTSLSFITFSTAVAILAGSAKVAG